MNVRALIIALSLLVLLLVSCESLDAIYSVLFHNWAVQAMPLVALALAAGIVLSCAQLDISSGAIFSLCGMLIIWWAREVTGDIIFGAALIFLVIVFVYYAMVVLIGKLGTPALLCTLAIALSAKAVTVIVYSYLKGVGIFAGQVRESAEVEIHLHEDELVGVFAHTEGNLIWCVVIVALLWVWRYKSDWGIKHIAVGMDRMAAKRAGISPRLILTGAFLMAGALVALASFAYLFDTSNGDWSPDIGWSRELTAIAATVIGGTRVSGGTFDPISTALAAILVFAVGDVIRSLDWPPDYALLGIGVVLLFVGAGSATLGKRTSGID